MAANPFDQFDQAGDNPFDRFDSAPTPPKAGAIRRIADMTAVPLAQGVVGVPEAAVGLADLVTGGHAGKFAEDTLGFRPREAKQIIGDALYSDEQKAANQKVAEAEGFLPTLQAAAQNPSVIARTAVESIPGMLAGGVIGRIAGKAAPVLSDVARGAIGEGGISAGQNAEQVRQENPTGTLTAGQSALLAGSGVVTGAISRLTGGLSKERGIGDIETIAAGGALPVKVAGKAAAQTQKGLARKAAEGFVTEGVLEELPQSVQEQVAQNLAQGKAWNDGVGNAAALGLLTGGVTGAAVGPLESDHEPEPKPKPAPLRLTNQPDPLLGFPDGTVARRSEAEAYIKSLPEEERAAARARMLGVNPQTTQAAAAAPPDAGPISRAAAVAPPPDLLPRPEGEDGKDGEGPAPLPPPAPPIDPNHGPISRAAAIAQGQTLQNAPTAPAGAAAAPQLDAPRETPPAAAPPPYTPQPGDIVVDDHFQAAHQGATSPLNDRPQPTAAQQDAENYRVGRTRVAGMSVSIENGQGTERRGVDPDGKPWTTLMKDHYGRLLGTTGADSTPQKHQHLDVFIKSGTPKDWKGDPVVIDTLDPKTGKLDEHKIVFGAADVADARHVFGRNYADGEARIMAATQVPMPQFKAWAYDGTQKTEPFAAAAPGISTESGKTAVAPPQEARVQRRLQKQGHAGRLAQRSNSYDRNPLMTFLATHGLFHVKGEKDSLKSEFSPDAHVAVPGYHISVFRREGKRLDLLVQPAIEEGYLPPGADEHDLYELIAAAFRGERVVPIHGEGQAEKEMQRQQARRDEDAQAPAEREVADFDDDVLVNLRHNLDDVPALDAPSSASLESAVRDLRFSEEEIAHAVEAAAGPATAPEAGQRRGEAGQAAPGEAEADPGRGDPEARAEAPDAQADLSAPAGAPAAPAAPAPLRLGITPANALPVTVQAGVVHIGKDPAYGFDSGEPVQASNDATPEQIKQALRDAGALSRRMKFFGGDKTGASIPAGGNSLAAAASATDNAPNSTAAAAPVAPESRSQQASAAPQPAASAAPASDEQAPEGPPKRGMDEAPRKTAAAAPAPAPQPKPSKTFDALVKRLEAYFQPGAIVQSYSGHDRVIEFTPRDSSGSWSVKVHAVVKQGDAWVDDPQDNRDRQHSTLPGERLLKAGPIQRAPAEAAPVASAPAAPTAAATTAAPPASRRPLGANPEIVEVRKQLSVLKKLRACVAAAA